MSSSLYRHKRQKQVVVSFIGFNHGDMHEHSEMCGSANMVIGVVMEIRNVLVSFVTSMPHNQVTTHEITKS